jgi:hypothetical protein
VTLVPLYGFLEGDTLGLLVLARSSQSVEELATTLRRAARLRAGFDGPAEVTFAGRVLSPSSTVASAGLRPLDRIDVRRVRPCP